MGRPSHDIVLCTLNARYAHPAFGLRCLLANLGPLQSRARLLEFDIKTAVATAAEAILAEQPRIVGLGAHIWNVALIEPLVLLLKSERPDLLVVLGGPEITDRETSLTRAARRTFPDG